VLVNRCTAKAGQKLNTGDEVELTLSPDQPFHLAAELIPLSIIYEDDDMVVVDKPAGLTTHPAPGHVSHTLVNALLAHYPELHNFSDSSRPGIVHRLDKDTSGLTIVAKNPEVQQKLINQFKNRMVSKGYYVLVKGKLAPLKGAIEAPLGRDHYNRKRIAVVEGAKEARTDYQVLEYISSYTFLDVSPKTGRTHQIRVHLSTIGYPVIGDKVYGLKVPFLNRQFLHAFSLKFKLPSSGEYIELKCELPSDLKLALDYIRRS
jgi:23S rRNA pseudouridine1911/1915/1917 synthase